MNPAGYSLALALLASGCLGRGAHEPTFYTLSPASGPSASPPVAVRPELGLVLGRIEIPRYLDRPELVTRSGPHRLRIWSGVRWGGSLRSDLERVVADDLARLLGTSRVAVYPDEARFPVSCRILLELLELGGAAGGPVTLRARWTLTAGDGHALATGESEVQQTPTSASWEDYVAAHAAALDEVVHEIAERIAALT